MAVILPDSTMGRGWVCPGCHRGYSPKVDECPHCPEPVAHTPERPASELAREARFRALLLKVALPTEMAQPDYVRIFKARRDWEDVWPGLQCCLSSFGGGNETAWASVRFRLTPEDGTAT